MALVWQLDLHSIDWNALSQLYRIAPLGEKKPDDLRVSFANSRYCAASPSTTANSLPPGARWPTAWTAPISATSPYIRAARGADWARK